MNLLEEIFKICLFILACVWFNLLNEFISNL